MSTFMDTMAKYGYPENEYLSYTYEKIRENPPMVEEGQLKGVLEDNKSNFVKRFNKLNGTNLLDTQIADILDDFTAGGNIGGRVLSVLQDVLKFQDGTNGLSGSVFTSGGVDLNLTVGDVSLSQALSAFEGRKGKSLDNINNIIEGVDAAIDSMIEVLAKTSFSAQAAVLLNSYYSGGVLSDRAKKIVEDYKIKTMSSEDYDKAKLDANAATIRENINKLKELSKNKTWGKVSEKGSQHEAYNTAIEAIKASFNSLGGTVYEMAYAWGLCTALYTGEEAIKKLEPTKDEFVKLVKSAWTGQVGAGSLPVGQELKSDNVITYTKDGVTVQLGGSIKLRQSAAFRGQGGKNSEALGVGGLIARGVTYKNLETRMEHFAPGLYESGYDMVALNKDSVENVGAEWEGLRQMTGALTFLDALSGLGDSIEDFSSFFIVNNRIFSVYDILDKLINNFSAAQLTMGKKGYIVNGFDLKKINNNIMNNSQTGGTVVKEALNRNKNARSILANTKISITLNLGHLYGIDVFK